jgi:hypothetical protein
VDLVALLLVDLGDLLLDGDGVLGSACGLLAFPDDPRVTGVVATALAQILGK